MAKQSKTSGQYKFRRHDNLGAAAAEDDERFLANCFEDNGDVDVLLDCKNPKRIVLGRTGAGKTALLMELAKRSEFVVDVRPEDLSLNYLTNSTILPYLEGLGVNLDPFYKLLWRHVFAVTIIQNHVDIVDQSKQNTFIEQVRNFFTSKDSKAAKQQKQRQSQKAIEYLDKWGDRFFEDVEHRTKAVIGRFENEIKKGVEAKLGGDIALPIGPLSPSISAARSTDRAERTAESFEVQQEVVERAKAVVADIQVKELSGILELLDELLSDTQKPCYIAIDQLDEPWAHDDLRMRLLKGLLDTVREFGKVHNAKIIICLRVDLIEQLFRVTRTEAGFQEDKYRSLYLPLRWSKQQLIELLDKRVACLARDAYTNYVPTLSDVITGQMKFGRKKQVDPVDYILERTWSRPRDAIEFLNACISKCEGKGSISKDAILDAEGEYSRARLRAMASEWHAQFPNLVELLKELVANRPSQFKLVELTDQQLEDWSLRLACSSGAVQGELHQLAIKKQSDEISVDELRRQVAAVLYKTGCVGLKTTATSNTRWATSESYSVSSAEIGDETSVSIHPGLWKVLGIVEA